MRSVEARQRDPVGRCGLRHTELIRAASRVMTCTRASVAQDVKARHYKVLELSVKGEEARKYQLGGSGCDQTIFGAYIAACIGQWHVCALL